MALALDSRTLSNLGNTDMGIETQALSEQDVSQVKLVTWVGLFVNLGLSALKFALGLLGGSQAVVADAVHSLSDMATDIAVLVGSKFWANPPDRNHPFGHRRIETLVTVGIGAALVFVAAGLGYKALSTVREAHIRQPMWIVAVAPVVSIVLKEILYRWSLGVGRRAKSPAVVANAWHHRSDAMSSVPALAAVILSRLNPDWAFMDEIGAIIISVFILKVAWDIAKPALNELSGQAATQADQDRIEEIVSRIEGVREAHAIRTRQYGGGILVDLHVLVSGDISVREGHDIAEEVQNRLVEHGPSVADVVVHIEPYEEAAGKDVS